MEATQELRLPPRQSPLQDHSEEKQLHFFFVYFSLFGLPYNTLKFFFFFFFFFEIFSFFFFFFTLLLAVLVVVVVVVVVVLVLLLLLLLLLLFLLPLLLPLLLLLLLLLLPLMLNATSVACTGERQATDNSKRHNSTRKWRNRQAKTQEEEEVWMRRWRK